MPTVPPVQVGGGPLSPQATQEAFIHGLVGAPFGDLEFDVGKSIRWTQWFVDDIYITDIKTGDPRYWIVNWTETFPQALHDVSSINYFVVPAQFRKAQFDSANARPDMLLEDNDWILFVDASEGMSCDTRSLPDDYLTQPFRSFVYREITRAVTASKDHVVIPFFVFLGHRNIQTIEYQTMQMTSGVAEIDAVQQSVGTPYYIANQGLARLWKVSALKAAGFDWTKLDQPQTPDAGVKVQLVSYAYAHWNLQDIDPPQTEVPPLDANNDDGWRMRKLISRVRPITGLPYTDPWKNPTLDATGVPGPWAGSQANAPVLGQYVPGYLTGTTATAVSPNTYAVRPMWRAGDAVATPYVNDFFLTSMVRFTALTGNQFLVYYDRDPASTGNTNAYLWAVFMQGTHLIFRYWTTAGVSVDLDLGTPPLVVGQDQHIGVAYTSPVPDLTHGYGSMVGLYSTDGKDFTTYGTPVTLPNWMQASVTQPHDLVIGSNFGGRIYNVEMDDANTLTEVWRFAADDYGFFGQSPPVTSWEDFRGREWQTTNVAALTASQIIPFTPPASDASTAAILVPLYDLVFRINLRDGVWYDTGQLGNVPLVWDNVAGKWAPVVDPDDWKNQSGNFVAPVSIS